MSDSKHLSSSTTTIVSYTPPMQATRRLRSRRSLGALAVFSLLLVAPACGGGDDEGADESGGGAASEAVAGTEVLIEDFVYKPEALRAEAGTPVVFTNKDTFAHTVTAKDKSYDSGNMDEGATFEHTYDEPGTYEYFCAIHNSMTGSVVVE